MKRSYLTFAVAAVAVGGLAAAAAWAVAPEKDRNTPASWPYEIKNGKRVPRVPRVVNADGSWTEEVRQGNCTVTRTGRDGEVREVRKCD
ncbi:MAG TPA: hypothetical protein VGD10_11365 [Allosphingosinicella sp.]|uniref:hypothetical protein n=1 Tax=Allosphingosinicella sp. TaxID=2823234 RepID=UPI002EDB1852